MEGLDKRPILIISIGLLSGKALRESVSFRSCQGRQQPVIDLVITFNKNIAELSV